MVGDHPPIHGCEVVEHVAGREGKLDMGKGPMLSFSPFGNGAMATGRQRAGNGQGAGIYLQGKRVVEEKMIPGLGVEAMGIVFRVLGIDATAP